MPIVTLTTDWGNGGFFAGMVKGRLYSLIDEVQVVDISHDLRPFDLREATFVVRHACTGFPEGTVHIIDVASNQTPDNPFIVVKYRGQFFICTDNGLPANVFGDEAEDISLIDVYQTGDFYNFAVYDLFAEVAALLIRGASMRDIGEPHPQLFNMLQSGYVEQGGDYRIYIHYVDNYGNAYLGMSYGEFERLRHGRQFELTVREYRINEVVHSYYDTPQNSSNRRQQIRLTVSSTGLLELAIKGNSFAELIGLYASDIVLLHFFD